MAARLFNLMLCALLLELSSLAAKAITHPENRVWGSPAFSSDFDSLKNAKAIAASGQNAACGYDFTSGTHKYLYAQDNPVMGIDPSGQDMDLVSVQFSMAIMGQVGAFDLRTSAAALHADYGISGSTDPQIAKLIYGLDVANIVMDKVTLVMAAYGLTMATTHVAEFLANNAYRFSGASVKTLEEFRAFASKPESYYTYKELRAAIQKAGLSGRNTGLEAHHLLEKQFASKLGVAEDQVISVALVPSQHRGVGGMGISIDSLINDRLTQMGTTAENATVGQIWKAHRDVYDAMGHPEWADAIYQAYFQGKGVPFY